MSSNNNTNFEEIRDRIFVEHNKIRTEPQSYIPQLEEYLNYFKENNILAKPGETQIQTNEGKEGYLEAIEFLKSQQPVNPLILDDNLNKAAEDHLKDIGPKGVVSHDSSDGKNVSDRIEVYTNWDVACGENLDFGTRDPISVIINLLVDDGAEMRPHRHQLFNSKFNFVGIAIGDHKEYETVVVIDYVGTVRPLGTPYFDYRNLKFDFNLLEQHKIKKPKSAFQLDDPDAPDGTVSIKIKKYTKMFDGRLIKITKKFYTLEDGSIHIVEIEDV